MKYILVLGDGMADYPISSLGNKTPLQTAKKPYMDMLAKSGKVGLLKTIPDGFKPGSDTANLAVLGYSPKIYYTGRSPLEALSLGIDMAPTDVAFRTNLVTLSDDEPFESKTMVDYSSGEISSAESAILIEAVQELLGNERFSFYAGVSYRHCLIAKNGATGTELTPPHDISGRCVGSYLPRGPYGEVFQDMMKRSYELLRKHPVNLERVRRGLNPANCVWFWGEGTRPALSDFLQKYGKRGAMISAVDLLKGIGKAANMQVFDVEGATGTVHTNYEGKANAAIEALNGDNDFVYIHVEATDESGHHGDVEEKIKGIELLDEKIVGRLYEYYKSRGEDFAMLVLPDHPTPISTMTHAIDPVPYVMWTSERILGNYPSYDEQTAADSGNYLQDSDRLMQQFLAL